MPWTTDFAPDRAGLASCVECGLCLPFCPTFRLTGDEAASPRGRLAAMAVVADGVAPIDERFDEVMSFCLQCRACEAVCPSLVPFGELMEGARAEVLAARPSAGRIMRRILFGRALRSRFLVRTLTVVIAVLQRMRLLRWLPGSLRRGMSLRPIPLPVPSTRGRVWEPQGQVTETVALLSGCIMEPWFGGVHEALATVLVAAGFRVVVPEDQTCCGALAAHEGAAYDAERMAQRNVAAFAAFDRVVVDAAGCGAHLLSYGERVPGGGDFAARVVDSTVMVSQLIEEGRIPMFPATGVRVAVQDPCHLRHAQRVVEAPRRVVEAAGFDPVDLDPQALCCGAAGAYALSHPQTSDELGRRKAAEVEEASVTAVVSANPGCEMQLRRHLSRGWEISHPVELYADALGAAVGGGARFPTASSTE